MKTIADATVLSLKEALVRKMGDQEWNSNIGGQLEEKKPAKKWPEV